MAINLFCLGNAVQSIIYKVLALEGKVTLLEYTLLRNFAMALLAIILLYVREVDFGNSLPKDKRHIMLARAVCGVGVALLINASLELIPFSLLVILFQTNPFWTSILSHFVNGEAIRPFEVIGMIVCFIAVIVIARHDDNDNLDIAAMDPEAQSSKRTHTLGIVLIMAAAVLTACSAVFNRAL